MRYGSRMPAVLGLCAAAVLGLGGCGSSQGTAAEAPGSGGQIVAARSFDVTIVSPAPNVADGTETTNVRATVYVPEHAQGQTYPLVLHSHGWGGSRYSQADVDAQDPQPGTTTTSMFALTDQRVEVLWNAGYAVISFDERGFGRGDDGDNGTDDGAHAMDPAFEIRDAMAVLDWAVENLDLTLDAPGDPRVGAIGGSYGGGYQLLLAAQDDRLDAITPSATWFSFAESLSPNRVIKKGFATGLCLLAQTDGAQLSAEVQAACDEGVTDQSTRFREQLSAEVQRVFVEHGLDFVGSQPGFVMPSVDALLIQGNRDILFNLSQAADNYAFLSAAGGDVRLLSHENGHSLAQLRSGPGSQGPLGNSTCGAIDSMQAIVAWFDAKLRGNAAAIAGLPRICISLDDDTGAIFSADVPRGDPTHRVTIPDGTQVTGAQHNNSASEAGEAVWMPLSAPIVGDDFVLAGIPVANVSIAGMLGEGVVFLGVGIERGGSRFLVDQQVQPVRSSDERVGDAPQALPLIGVGEKLQDGDVVGVLIYGQHDQYENEARTLYSANAATISGTVDLPIVQGAELTLLAP